MTDSTPHTPLPSVDIILPTLNRPARLREALAWIRATSPFAGVIVVTPDRESLAIARDFGYPTIRAGGTGVQKWNLGAEASTADWLTNGADDSFHQAGWFEAALAVDRGGYVGLRDAADSTHEWFEHYLLSRAFRTQHAGGCLMLPCYQSQYADVEMHWRAVRAGVVAATSAIVVDHRHWTNGGAAFDATYQLSRQAAAGDSATFERRRRAGVPDDFAAHPHDALLAALEYEGIG